MALCEKILLTGFSGAGKSSLIQSLRENPPAGWSRFDDLDELVLKNRGKNFSSLSELIADQGWEKFRLWERQELEGWLKEEGKGVIALGGGAVGPLLLELYGHQTKIKFVHLEVSFESAWKRLSVDTDELRPLVSLGKAGLYAIYLERVKIFSQFSLTIDAEAEARTVYQNLLTIITEI